MCERDREREGAAVCRESTNRSLTFACFVFFTFDHIQSCVRGELPGVSKKGKKGEGKFHGEEKREQARWDGGEIWKME